MKLEFHPISCADAPLYRKVEREDILESCDHIFGSVLFWSETYQTEMTYFSNCILLRYLWDGIVWFSFPLGGTEEEKVFCIQTLLRHCTEVEHDKLRFSVLTESHRTFLMKHFPHTFEIDTVRDRFDYMYETERLITLKGSKLSAKRNHIHRFEDRGEWAYEELSSGNLKDCWDMEEEWIGIQEVSEEERLELEDEKKAVKMAIDHFEELNLIGGLIRQNGQVVAFTIGERLNQETVVCHFEKAYFNIQGAYQIINQQFLLHHRGEFRYVNREDDAGNLGLRKSKMSYYPDLLVSKYSAVSGDVVYAAKDEADDILKLWEECFGDTPEYINFYLEHRFTEENMLVIHEDGKIVSMASFWDAALKKGEEELPVKYVYAVATAKEYRKRGYAAKLLEHAANKYQCPLILQPAEQHLFKYYTGLGFCEVFLQSEEQSVLTDAFMQSEAETEMTIIRQLSEEQVKAYMKLREQTFAQQPYVKWDEKALTYAMDENTFCGGGAAFFSDGAILYRISEEILYILEYAVPQSKIQTYTNRLMQYTGTKKYLYKNHGGMILCDTATRECFFGENGGYLSLTLG